MFISKRARSRGLCDSKDEESLVYWVIRGRALVSVTHFRGVGEGRAKRSGA